MIVVSKQRIFIKSQPPSLDCWLRMCDLVETADLEENWENAQGFLAADEGDERWCPFIAMIEEELERRRNAVES